MDIFSNNISAREIIRRAIERSNKPLNKYNTAMHTQTEALSGIPNDRTGYDAGNDPEIINNDNHQ
jgi:hypothetical protein